MNQYTFYYLVLMKDANVVSYYYMKLGKASFLASADS